MEEECFAVVLYGELLGGYDGEVQGYDERFKDEPWEAHILPSTIML